MKKEKVNIVYLGELGFPYGFAGVQRALLISKGLRNAGANVTVISRKGIYDPKNNPNLKSGGEFEGIKFVFTSRTPYRPNKFMTRNFFKLKGLINEIIYFYKLNTNFIDSALLSTRQFSLLIYYRLISKILKISLILNCVELNSAINSRHGLLDKINDYLYEKYVFTFIDGILPISDFLVNFAKKSPSNIPYLKIPVLCDFNKFKCTKQKSEKKYFLFCGSAGYLEIIIFILQAFDLLKNNNQVLLYLILHGNSKQLSAANSEINKTEKKKLIKAFSNLPYNQLVNIYTNALGLLIPIRPNLEDNARFPHKIGEYTASGKPIITTNYGEIPNYFVDNDSALIAKNYSIYEFADKLNFVITNPKKAIEIGKKGRLIGLNNFNYEIYGPKIKSFIMSLDLSEK
jgi:glycosyltransferase involved in cell wall biosynthesis